MAMVFGREGQLSHGPRVPPHPGFFDGTGAPVEFEAKIARVAALFHELLFDPRPLVRSSCTLEFTNLHDFARNTGVSRMT